MYEILYQYQPFLNLYTSTNFENININEYCVDTNNLLLDSVYYNTLPTKNGYVLK